MVIGFVRDITDRKQAEEKLREAYGKLEERVEERTRELAKVNEELQIDITKRKQAEEEIVSVVEGMLEVVAIIDFDGTIRQVNTEFARGSGWKREELIGKKISELGIMTE